MWLSAIPSSVNSSVEAIFPFSPQDASASHIATERDHNKITNHMRDTSEVHLGNWISMCIPRVVDTRVREARLRGPVVMWSGWIHPLHCAVSVVWSSGGGGHIVGRREAQAKIIKEWERCGGRLQYNKRELIQIRKGNRDKRPGGIKTNGKGGMFWMAPEVALKFYLYRNVLVYFPLFFAVIVRIRAGLNHDYYKEIKPTTRPSFILQKLLPVFHLCRNCK